MKIIFYLLLMFQSISIAWADADSENPVKTQKPCGFTSDMNCFENGKAADAEMVNANFKALLEEINQLKADLNELKTAEKRGLIQIVQVVKTDTFGTNSTEYTDITGLSASIKLSSENNKILVQYVLSGAVSGADYIASFRIIRNSEEIGSPPNSSDRTLSHGAIRGRSGNRNAIGSESGIYLDTPNSTDILTYKIQVKLDNSSFHLNETTDDGDTASYPRTVSSITLTEIAP